MQTEHFLMLQLHNKSIKLVQHKQSRLPTGDKMLFKQFFVSILKNDIKRNQVSSRFSRLAECCSDVLL